MSFNKGGGIGGGGVLATTDIKIVKVLADLPAPTLKDGVMTIILEDKEYLQNNDINSAFPLALPGAGKRATWKAVNGSKWNYTGADACWRDKDAEGDVELHGQVEFTATNGNMFDILAVTGSFSFQGVTIPRFRDCKSLGIVSGGAGGNGAFNTFFGTYANFFDGLILDNLFFNEESTMFVDGNNAAKLDYDGQTVDFTIGETVTDGVTGATGVVEIDTDSGVDGTLVLSSVVGVFQNDSALTGSSTGVAVVDGALQNTVMFTVQGAATSGSINFLNNTFFASANETFLDLKTEVQAGIDSINLRGNQVEGLLTASAFAPGSLNQKSLKVFSVANTFFPNSKVIGSSFVKDNATATSVAVNGTFNDIDFGTLSAGSNIERFTLTNAANGEKRYDGEVDFDGEMLLTFSALSTGGARVFTVRLVIDTGSGYGVLPDDIVTEVEIGGTLGPASLLVPICLKNGDLVKPEVTRDAGTSTITFKQYSDAIT